MKKIVLVFICLSMFISADVLMQKAKNEDPEISLPLKKPIHPLRLIRPIINTGIVYQDNYYTSRYETNCDKYIEILAQKDQEILELKQEIERLKSKEQAKMQKNSKKPMTKRCKSLKIEKVVCL